MIDEECVKIQLEVLLKTKIELIINQLEPLHDCWSMCEICDYADMITLENQFISKIISLKAIWGSTWYGFLRSAYLNWSPQMSGFVHMAFFLGIFFSPESLDMPFTMNLHSVCLSNRLQFHCPCSTVTVHAISLPVLYGFYYLSHPGSG